MRKFYLENTAGERVGLNGEDGIWLEHPSGLGIANGTKFTDLKHGFFAVADDETEPQATPAGTLVFHCGDPYGRYLRLADWVARTPALYLIYAPGAVEYRRRVSLHYLTKTELEGPRWMRCPVAFLAMTPWHTSEKAVLQLATLADDALRCDYEGSVLDAAILAPNTNPGASGDIQPGGHYGIPFRFVYTGELANPVLTVTGQNTGTEYGRCALNLTLAAGETLIVSTEYDNAGIWILRGGVLYDAIEAADLAYDPFPRASRTEPCTLTLAASGAIQRTADVTVFYYYRGV